MVQEALFVNTETPFRPLPAAIVTGRWKKWGIKIRLLFFCMRLVFLKTRSFSKVFEVLLRLRQYHRKSYKFGMLKKFALIEGKAYWHLFSGGAPSEASRKGLESEISRMLCPERFAGVRTLMLAITKKCPLACEHCFEADFLQGAEVWSRDELVEIVRQYQAAGTSMFWLGGGEPMVRFKDLRYLLQKASCGSDFWIGTCGYRLDEQAARALKADGLSGVIVSLDHYDPEAHNRFRGSPHAFQWAIRACTAAKEAGLVTVLSVCATRSFTSEENFRQYMELARNQGVAFVLLLEPKAAGRYAEKEVTLLPEQKHLLERLAITYNTHPDYVDYPIVEYPDMLTRQIGCGAAGHRFLYINANGMVQVCPFCHTEVAKALAFSPEETIRLAAQMSCPAFERATI